MCFYIHKDHKKVKITKKNIICWKRFKVNGIELNIYYSPYYHFPYIKNIVYYEDSILKKDQKKFVFDEIHSGFHSYTSRYEAEMWKNSNEFISQCIIPKGSRYYHNPQTKQYVSDHLFIGTEKQYKKKYPYGYSNKLIK